MTDRLDEIRKRYAEQYEFALHPELARVDIGAALADIAYLLEEVEQLRDMIENQNIDAREFLK